VSYQQNRKRVTRPAGWRVKLPGNITVIKDVEYDRVLHNGEIVAKCSNLTGISTFPKAKLGCIFNPHYGPGTYKYFINIFYASFFYCDRHG
jgi:hypothetical protein